MNIIDLNFILAKRYTFTPNSNTLVDDRSPSEIQHLGSNESRILQYFALHPNQIVRRDDLHDYVWRQQGFEVDDSSLTQAISTLRKTLNDSIKSPMFIRTVPKQGYQWIAEVEAASFEKSQQNCETEASSTSIDQVQTNDSKLISLPIDSSTQEPIAKQNVFQYAPSGSINQSWLVKLLILIAILIPVTTLYGFDAKHAFLQPVKQIDDIEVLFPASHPDIDFWLPEVERCISIYNKFHSNQPKPNKVIVTGGQESTLMLNYLYNEENIDLSRTVVISKTQPEWIRVCQ
ncbi:winged helix-turn-helix domain-containing protein [Vibrio sp. WJH972]